MTRIIITGANGKMGHVIRSVVAGREDCTVVAGVDFNTQAADFPIYKTCLLYTSDAADEL